MMEMLKFLTLQAFLPQILFFDLFVEIRTYNPPSRARLRMADDNPPYRPANGSDRPCDECLTPMIGIMRVSDRPTCNPPRKICFECETKLKGSK